MGSSGGLGGANLASLAGPGVFTRGDQLNTLDAAGNPRNVVDDGAGNAAVAAPNGLTVGPQAQPVAGSWKHGSWSPASGVVYSYDVGFDPSSGNWYGSSTGLGGAPAGFSLIGGYYGGQGIQGNVPSTGPSTPLFGVLASDQSGTAGPLTVYSDGSVKVHSLNIDAATTATTATAGTASALPSAPAIYFEQQVNGTTYKVPGYLV